jgi:hypothetical protein
MSSKTARKPYRKPIVQKQRRLTDVAEGVNIITSGPIQGKGGCFSNNR